MNKARIIAILLPAIFFNSLYAQKTKSAEIPGSKRSQPNNADTTSIRKTLDTLYKSFGFAAGKEPDWKIMRSMALPGATFVPAPQSGTKRSGVGIDKFINDYKAYVKSSPLRVTGYYEHLLSVRINRLNTVATATAVFRASVPGEKRKRKPGMDNIQLLLINGSWKIVAFTTQSESDPG